MAPAPAPLTPWLLSDRYHALRCRELGQREACAWKRPPRGCLEMQTRACDTFLCPDGAFPPNPC